MIESPKEHCFRELKSRILTTKIPPGAALDEALLTEQYGISRTPLREVFQRLTALGFVRITANRGATVNTIDLNTLPAFFQTAPMIYASISRLAAENRTHEELEALIEAQEQFCRAIGKGDAPSVALADHRFHAMIGQMAKNPYLMVCLDRLLVDHTRLGRSLYYGDERRQSSRIQTATAHHFQLIEAIEMRDADRAIEATNKHWDLSRNSIEGFLRPEPLPAEVAHGSSPP